MLYTDHVATDGTSSAQSVAREGRKGSYLRTALGYFPASSSKEKESPH